MFKKTIQICIIWITILALSGFTDPTPQAPPPPLSPESLMTTAGPDEYGYTLTDATPYSFEDISAFGLPINYGTKPVSDGTVPIIIQNFKYYDLSDTYVAFVDVDGFITLVDPRPTRLTNNNKPFPTDSKPNAMLSAFWADLTLETSSTIYHWDYPSPDPNPRSIIQWNNVYAGAAIGFVTFEVILYESGRIDYAYKPTSAIISGVTAGIEDPDGVTGLNYAIPDLTTGKRVTISHPPPGVHVKARPQISSGFFDDHEAWYSVDITNNTDSGVASDSYLFTSEIQDQLGGPWSVTYYDPTCTSVITSLTGLNKGATRKLCMLVSAGGDLIPGNFVRHKITITSQADASRSSSIYLQSVIGTPFTQLYQDSTTGLKLDLTTAKDRVSHTIANPYNGTHMSMNQLWPGHYIISWLEGVLIRYRLYNQATDTLNSVGQINASADEPRDQVDLAPAVSGSRDGHIGILYLVNVYQEVSGHTQVNSNVFFSLLRSDGTPDAAPRNMTGNSAFLDLALGTDGVAQYFDPRIVPAGDNEFALIWRAHEFPSLAPSLDRIVYAIAPSDGSDPFYSDVPGSDESNRHVYPSATGLEDGRFILGYLNYTGGTNPWGISYTVINPDGGISIPSRSISNTDARDMDMVEMADGKVIISWSNFTNSKISFAILGSDLYTLPVLPTDLTYFDYTGHPNYRRSSYVSATSDTNNHAILTWQDADWQEQLYYVVIGSDGAIITPPMLYRRVGTTYPESQLSSNGYGNAPLAQERLMLPIVMNKYSFNAHKYYFGIILKQ